MSLLDLAHEAEDAKDEKASGNRVRTLPREGVALLRMCSYIETGVFKGEWKGAERINAKVLVEFELVHPDHKIMSEDGQQLGYHRIWVRLNKSGHEKGNYMKFFKKLNYDNKVKVKKKRIPNMSKFLGDGFLGQVYHNVSGDKTYANLDSDGVYSIRAPRTQVQDAATNMPTDEWKDIVVPEMSVKPKLFLWESPNMSDSNYMSMFESIYIEGEYEGKSKNWIQDTILSPENIALPGSTAERLFVEHRAFDSDFVTEVDPALN